MGPREGPNQSEKHGVSFEEAERLFTSGVDYLDVYDEEHSQQEDRFIGIGPIHRGVVVVAYTERHDGVIRIVSARMATKKETSQFERYWRERNG